MRILIILLLLIPIAGWCQEKEFPAGWKGNWKGELHWYSGNEKEHKDIPMELQIQPTDSANKYSWKLIYGTPTENDRAYTLKVKDIVAGHWVIDENNGIVLDAYLVGNKLSVAFTVQSSTIINNYWMENNQLHAEFYSMAVNPVSVSGKGTSDSPVVKSYHVKYYQKAVLARAQ